MRAEALEKYLATLDVVDYEFIDKMSDLQGDEKLELLKICIKIEAGNPVSSEKGVLTKKMNTVKDIFIKVGEDYEDVRQLFLRYKKIEIISQNQILMMTNFDVLHFHFVLIKKK